jgi:hypothetical protein
VRCVVATVTGGFGVLAGVLLCAPASAAEAPNPTQPELLTNLFQLRHAANLEPAVVLPFRIVADVWDVDSASGVLVLRDLSGVEFIRWLSRAAPLNREQRCVWKEEDAD